MRRQHQQHAHSLSTLAGGSKDPRGKSRMGSASYAAGEHRLQQERLGRLNVFDLRSQPRVLHEISQTTGLAHFQQNTGPYETCLETISLTLPPCVSHVCETLKGGLVVKTSLLNPKGDPMITQGDGHPRSGHPRGGVRKL